MTEDTKSKIKNNILGNTSALSHKNNPDKDNNCGSQNNRTSDSAYVTRSSSIAFPYNLILPLSSATNLSNFIILKLSKDKLPHVESTDYIVSSWTIAFWLY